MVRADLGASGVMFTIDTETGFRDVVLVVALSFGVQVWSHHNELLAKFLKTSLLGFSDCVMLLAVSAVPLLALEATKVLRNRSSR
jgi:Pyruvate phosphate dikinase, AMP/ATP-binding domain